MWATPCCGPPSLADLIAMTFRAPRLSPLLFTPRGASRQPIDTSEVATRLVEIAGAAPAERSPDIGGPEIRRHIDLARDYLARRGSRRPVAAVGVPDRIAAGYRAGARTAPQNSVGTVRFEVYLRRS